MPTPNFYRNFATKNLNNKRTYLCLSGVGLLFSIIAGLLMAIFEINLLAIIGIGMFLQFWGVLLFGAICKFEKIPKSKYKLIKFIRNCDDWLGVIFFDIFLLSIAAMSVFLIVASIIK